jgi:hypothetical protein
LVSDIPAEDGKIDNLVYSVPLAGGVPLSATFLQLAHVQLFNDDITVQSSPRLFFL